MTFPIVVIIVAAANWPATLILAVIVATFGARLQGGWRIVCFAVAGVLLAAVGLGVTLLSGWRAAGAP